MQFSNQQRKDRSLREILGLPDTAIARATNKRASETTDILSPRAPTPNQRRLPIPGLLNPESTNPPTEALDCNVGQIMAQGEDEDTVLTPKENYLPRAYQGNGNRAFHQPLGIQLFR